MGNYSFASQGFILRSLIFLSLTLFVDVALGLPTRDFEIPQAEVTPPGIFRVEVGTERAFQKKDDNPITDGHSSNVGVVYGLRKMGLIGVEMGIDWAEPVDADLPESLSAHTRVSTVTLEERGWGTALGIHSVGFKSNVNDANIMYGLIQNKFWDSLYVQFGGYSGSNKILVDEDGGDSSSGYMFGLWYKIQREGRGRIGLEWASGRSYVGKTSLGLSVEIDKGVYGYVHVSLPNNTETYSTSTSFRFVVDM